MKKLNLLAQGQQKKQEMEGRAENVLDFTRVVLAKRKSGVEGESGGRERFGKTRKELVHNPSRGKEF